MGARVMEGRGKMVLPADQTTQQNVRHKLAHVGQWQYPLLVGWLEFNVRFQHKYGYIRDVTAADVWTKTQS